MQREPVYIPEEVARGFLITEKGEIQEMEPLRCPNPKCGQTIEFAEKSLQEEFDIYIWDDKKKCYVFFKTQKGENRGAEIICNKCEYPTPYTWSDLGA